MTNKGGKSRIIIGIIVIILMALVVGSILYTQGKEKYNNLGIEEYQKGNYNKAISYFNKAIELDPNNAFAYNNRGLAHSELKEYNKAISDYNKAIALKPDYAIAYFNRGLSYFATGSYYNSKPFESAVSDFSKAIELKPDYVGAYYNRGLAYCQFFHYYMKLPSSAFPPVIENKYNKALADFDKVLGLDPLYVLAYAGKGNAYYRYGDSYEEMKRAIAEYDKALKSESLIVEGVGNKGLAGVYASRARAYLYMEEQDKATSDYIKAMELYPELMTAVGHQAFIYLDLKQYGKALELSKKYVDLTEAEGDAEGYYAYICRGMCYYNLKDYDKAIPDFKKVIDDYESHFEAEAHRYLGRIYSEKGDEKRAKEYFEKAIELCTKQIDRGGIDIPGAYYERGLSYMGLKEYDRAISDFKKVIELKTMSDREFGHMNHYNEAHRSLGIAYSQINETEKAKEYFEMAIELYEKPGGAKYKVEEVEDLLNKL